MKLVFIPGLMCTAEIWHRFSGLRNEYTIEDIYLANQNNILSMADTIAKNISASEAICLVSFSMGGYVALELATRDYSWLKKLVLINTTAAGVSKESLPERQSNIELAKQGNLEVITTEISKDFFNPCQKWIDLEQRMCEQIGAEGYVNLQTAIINRTPYKDKLANIKAETLIISSKHDQVLPYQDSVFLFENINDSSLLLLSQSGHSSPIEKGDYLQSVIKNFL